MAREIKFRARALRNEKHLGIKVGDFVYGCFIKTNVDAPCIVFGDGVQIEVDESTLGQYTGLKDKNGVQIYEGDILKDSHDGVTIGDIAWGDACFNFSCGENCITNFDVEEDLEIVGNVYQNPELWA